MEMHSTTPRIPLGILLAVAATGLFLTMTTAGLLSANQTVPSSGTVGTVITTVNVGVYSDSRCTQSLESFNWGSLSPGSTVTRIMYIKNTGDTSITLSMTKSNWNPASANGPITLSWNREGTSLTVGQSTMVTLTLGVSSSISGITTFSVDIVITGTG
jgi:hypothetical protein